MKPVNVCVTVFNRYDLLRKLMVSLESSEIRPACVYIIDRGNDSARLATAIAHPSMPYRIVTLPGQNLAAAWNWFIMNVPEERILASDDIEFYPESLRAFVETPGDLVGITDNRDSSAYACFLIRDSCVAKVGLFDEDISPDYMYYEDCDYGWRMTLAGATTNLISCLCHHGQQSLARKTGEQMLDHDRRFQIATTNYQRKWGGMPGSEKYRQPFNREVGA